jgi:hypothetical protein
MACLQFEIGILHELIQALEYWNAVIEQKGWTLCSFPLTAFQKDHGGRHRLMNWEGATRSQESSSCQLKGSLSQRTTYCCLFQLEAHLSCGYSVWHDL